MDGATAGLDRLLLKRSNPDVAIANGVAVVLQGQRSFVWSGLVRRAFTMSGGAAKLDIVLDEDAIVKDGDACGTEQLARCVEARAVKDDVVGLPLPRWA